MRDLDPLAVAGRLLPRAAVAPRLAREIWGARQAATAAPGEDGWVEHWRHRLGATGGAGARARSRRCGGRPRAPPRGRRGRGLLPLCRYGYEPRLADCLDCRLPLLRPAGRQAIAPSPPLPATPAAPGVGAALGD